MARTRKQAPRKQATRRQATRKPPARTPEGDVLATLGLGRVALSLDPLAYPLRVVHATAYLFLGKAYVRLDRERSGRLVVSLSGKQPLGAAGLRALAGEFANELTNQFVRDDVSRKTTRLREQVVGRALLGALGTGDELSGFGGDDAAYSGPQSTPAAIDYRQDPLGIARDWEERFAPGQPGREAALSASDPGKKDAAEELAARGLEPQKPMAFPVGTADGKK